MGHILASWNAITLLVIGFDMSLPFFISGSDAPFLCFFVHLSFSLHMDYMYYFFMFYSTYLGVCINIVQDELTLENNKNKNCSQTKLFYKHFKYWTETYDRDDYLLNP